MLCLTSLSLSIYLSEEARRERERGRVGGERLGEEGGGQRDRKQECDSLVIGGEGELEGGRA